MNEEAFYSQATVSAKHRSNAMSQYSKVTTMVQRKTRDIDEDEDLMALSQSSNTQLQKIDGNLKEQQVDLNYLRDINNECNYLITKFENTPTTQLPPKRAESTKARPKEREGSRGIQSVQGKTQKEQLSLPSVPKEEQSTKTLGVVPKFSKVILPQSLSGKSEIHISNHYSLVQDEGQNQNNSLPIQFPLTGSNRGRSIINNQTAELQQRVVSIRQENVQDSDVNSKTAIQQIDKLKLEQDGSYKYVSSYHNNTSKFSISDQDRKSSIVTNDFRVQPGSQGIQTQHNELSKDDFTASNRVTFRKEDEQPYSIQYNLPQDDSVEKKKLKESSVYEHQAQFDLQNFSAFERKLESVNTSKDLINHSSLHQQDDINQQNYKNSIVANVYTDDGEPRQQVLSERRYQLPDDEATPEKLDQQELHNEQEDDDAQYDDDQNFEEEDQEDEQDDQEEEQEEDNQSGESDNPSQLNDDVIYNRLPKNFFVKEDEEHKDMNGVLSSIKQMRQDFLGYLTENNIQEKLDEISNIIQPDKFIQKHFEAEVDDGEDQKRIMFQKVIQPKPKVSQKDYDADRVPEQPDKNLQKSGSLLYEELYKRGTAEEVEERLKNTIIEEAYESSPEQEKGKGYQHFKPYKPSQATSKKHTPKGNKSIVLSQQESQRANRIKSSNNKAYSIQSTGPRHLKIADYFKADPPVNQDPPSIPFKEQKQEDEDTLSLNSNEKEQLKEKMEQDILSNLDINFLFKKGDDLRHGLIDQKKAYKVMMKIKDIASMHIEQGVKEIDYNEIVRFLKEEDIYDQEKKTNMFEQEQAEPNSEPIKSKILYKDPEPPEDPNHWTQVVDFMRKNPKLLLQMLPDSTGDDEIQKKCSFCCGGVCQQHQPNNQRNKLLSQIEEAKRWNKLQQLSKSFLNNKKDFIQIIEQQQIRNDLASPKESKPQKWQTKVNSKKSRRKSPNKDMRDIMGQSNLHQVLSGNEQSDNEAQQPKEPIRMAQSRSTQQKSYIHGSATTAKSVYSNAPFVQEPESVPQVTAVQVALQQQEKLNQKRPMAQSQQQQRSKSKNILKKGSIVSTTMGDITTIGTTATGNVTQMHFYHKEHLHNGSQNQTIEEAKSGGESMFQNYYSNQGGIMGNAQRRPITAHVGATQNKSLAYMKPVLRQRQDLFEYNSAKGARMQSGGSHSKQREIVQNVSAHNYQTQANDLENSYVYKSGEGALNQSFKIGQQKFLPSALGPSKKTQKFIDKIAPNLKESEHYNMFMMRARKNKFNQMANISEEIQIFSKQKRGQSTELVGNQARMPKRLLEQRRSDHLNQSSNSINTKIQIDGSNYENTNTPQGIFPKFVKNTALHSNFSQKESLYNRSQQANDDQQPNIHKPKKFVDQYQQTRIGGVEHKILISPQLVGADPYQIDGGPSQLSHQDSQQSEKFHRKFSKVPIIDWAQTYLFQRCLRDDMEFNKEMDMSLYKEGEVDYVIEMMKNKYKEFKRSDIMRPFNLKAQQTLKNLLQEQSMNQVYEKQSAKYSEITIENTMKLLIRCKLAFHSRTMIADILKSLILYELLAVDLKDRIDNFPHYKVLQPEYDEIQLKGNKVLNTGHQLLTKIKALRSCHKQFKTPFIFKNKDYVHYVKNEMAEIKKLISIYKLKGPNDDLEEQQKLEAQELLQIEEQKNENEEQSYYSTEQNNPSALGDLEGSRPILN